MGAWKFRSEWRLDAPVQRVFAALADVEGYPNWWPQVRAARRIDEHSGELVCRSRLPYDLRFTLSREVEDDADGVLRARLTGDLDGMCQWTVSPAGAGAVAVFDEDADLRMAGLRRVSRLLRPVLANNHDHMMRGGERGLRALLANG